MAPSKSPQFLPASGLYFPGAYTSMISALSLHEKQKILHRVAQGLDGGPEILESWTRKDLLQLICLEMGKERKYTGVSKGKMIEQLMKLVEMKGIREERVITHDRMSVKPHIAPQSLLRRQRKVGRPARVQSSIEIPVDIDAGNRAEISWVCRNTACKAQLLVGANFCQRCSCCICRNFDDNKDPSLWIVCTPEPHHRDVECRLSCHVECALKKGIAGVLMEGSEIILDGSYRCYSCGKVSSLIGCLKKQLLVAREARRVDTLCQRLSLCHRLLNGTKKHKELDEFVERAIEKLEEEVGPIIEGSAKFARGLVNRLSSSAEVLQLITSALGKADTFHEDLEVECQTKIKSSVIQEKNDDDDDLLCNIEFNKVSSTSISLMVQGGGELVNGYRLWHRRATDENFPNNPTCIISTNPGEAQISNLEPCTEYDFCVVPFSERGIGEPAEASCCTKREISREFSSNSDEWYHPTNVEEEIYMIIDKPESNFKVRDLGKVLHSAWSEPSEVIEGIFNGKGWGMNSCNEGGKNKVRNCGPNVFSSSVGKMSGVDDDDACKATSEDKTWIRDLNVSANLDLAVEESRVTLEVEDVNRTISRRNSTGLLQESYEAKDANVAELDDASDPGNSQISQTEASGIISHALQANARGELHDDEPRIVDDKHGHGESWAMQVRGSGKGVGMEPMLRKKTMKTFNRDIDNDDDDGYGIVNGCGGGSIGGPLCASRNYELCVKIVRWLECQGLVKEDFRMKFLTWFSLRASEHEKRVVSVFIDTLQDNPASLAEQLVDTFSDIISSNRRQMTSNGFCSKLWH